MQISGQGLALWGWGASTTRRFCAAPWRYRPLRELGMSIGGTFRAGETPMHVHGGHTGAGSLRPGREEGLGGGC